MASDASDLVVGHGRVLGVSHGPRVQISSMKTPKGQRPIYTRAVTYLPPGRVLTDEITDPVEIEALRRSGYLVTREEYMRRK